MQFHTRRSLATSILTVLLSVSSSSMTTVPAFGQVMVRSAGGDNSDALVVHELGVVVGPSEDGSTVEIQMLLPNVEREQQLETGDLVFMIDGARIGELATLREAYNGASAGAVVKLAIRRGDERFLTSFERASPEEMAHGPRMMVFRGEGSEILPIHEIGAIVGADGGKISVTVKLPIGDSDVEEGDVVVEINGQRAETFGDLRAVYEDLEVGSPLELTFEREGEPFSIQTVRADPPAGMRIERGSR